MLSVLHLENKKDGSGIMWLKDKFSFSCAALSHSVKLPTLSGEFHHVKQITFELLLCDSVNVEHAENSLSS